MADEVKQTESPEEQKRKLDEYRDKLVKAGEAIKARADVLNKLHDLGINSVGDIEALKLGDKQSSDVADKQARPEQAKDEDLFAFDKDEKVTALEKEVADLKGFVQKQNQAMRGDRLKAEISAKIKDNAEFPLLSKGLNDNIVANILNQIDVDHQANKAKGLAEYLKDTEQQLQGFFTQLGGKLEQPKQQGFLETPKPLDQAVTPNKQPQLEVPVLKTAQQTAPKDNASVVQLPTFGSGDPTPASAKSIREQVVIGPGKIDDRQAFEDHLRQNLD